MNSTRRSLIQRQKVALIQNNNNIKNVGIGSDAYLEGYPWSERSPFSG